MEPKPYWTANDGELKNSILNVLNNCYGIDNAISQNELANRLKSLLQGKKNITTRQNRNAINELRNDGHLICSTTGMSDNAAGYYLPVTLQEYERYRAYHARIIKTNAQTLRAMDKAAELAFPYDMQPGLFDDLKEFACLES